MFCHLCYYVFISKNSHQCSTFHRFFFLASLGFIKYRQKKYLEKVQKSTKRYEKAYGIVKEQIIEATDGEASTIFISKILFETPEKKEIVFYRLGDIERNLNETVLVSYDPAYPEFADILYKNK